MKSNSLDQLQCVELDMGEYHEIFGGDRFTESIFRMAGYLARKWSDIDWVNSSLVENQRAQR